MLVLPNQKLQLPFPGAKKKFTKYNKEAGKGNLIVTNKISGLASVVKHVNEDLTHVKTLIIDDFTHFFNAETQSESFRAKQSGGEAFKRWADLAAAVFNSVFRTQDTRDDLTIVLCFHPEVEETLEGTKFKIKTPGKLLDRDIDIPSYFTYMLYTKVLPPKEGLAQEDRYKFVTNDDGSRPAKTPMGCFSDMEVANDLAGVIKTIDAYALG